MDPAPPTPLLPVALLLLGVAMVVPYVVAAARAWLEPESFASVVERLLAAGNVDRAVKLTQAVAHLPLLSATREALVAGREGLRADDDAAAYRAASAPGFEAQLAALRVRYDAAFARVRRPVALARWVALVGALPLLAAPLCALVLAWDGPSPMWVVGAAPLGLAVLAWAGYRETRIAQSRGWLFERLRGRFEALLRTGAPQTAPRETAAAHRIV